MLSDERIELYGCGRDDIRSGQIDRRVLATLEYLAESGLKPTVTSLKCGHGFLTNVRQRLRALLGQRGGHREDQRRADPRPPGGRRHHRAGRPPPDAPPGHDAARTRSSRLLEIGGPPIAMGDHADHIHVGFRPLFGANSKLGRQALAVLKPGQWSDLIDRLARDR